MTISNSLRCHRLFASALILVTALLLAAPSGNVSGRVLHEVVEVNPDASSWQQSTQEDLEATQTGRRLLDKKTCATAKNPCPSPHSVCQDSAESSRGYACVCEAGYTKNNNGNGVSCKQNSGGGDDGGDGGDDNNGGGGDNNGGGSGDGNSTASPSPSIAPYNCTTYNNCTIIPKNCSFSSDNDMLTHGPFGMGKVGSNFSDLSYTAGGLSPITRIVFTQKGTITGLQVWYGGTAGPRYSAFNGPVTVRDLLPNEFIIKARVAYLIYVWGIVFTTTLGRDIVIGGPPANWGRGLKIAESPAVCGGQADHMVLLTMSGVSRGDGCIEQVNLIWGNSPLPYCPAPSAVVVQGPAGTTQPWANPSFKDNTASFIWTSASSDVTADAYAPLPTFYKVFDSPITQVGYLHLIVDDFAEVFLNGALIGQFTGGYLVANVFPYPYAGRPVKVTLRAGPNMLAIRATNMAVGPAAVAASVLSRNNRTVLFHTDATWSYFENPAADILGTAEASPWPHDNIDEDHGFPDHTANWIWSDPDAGTWNVSASDAVHTFSYVYPSSVDIPAAKLHIMADAVADVYVNNVFIATVTGGYVKDAYGGPLTVSIKGGFGNFFTIRCRNTDGGKAGLMAAVYASSDHESLLFHTDDKWAYNVDSCQPAF